MSKECQPQPILKSDTAKLDTGTIDINSVKLRTEAAAELSSPLKGSISTTPEEEKIRHNQMNYIEIDSPYLNSDSKSKPSLPKKNDDSSNGQIKKPAPTETDLPDKSKSALHK
jgi:hypothetical protein